MHSKRGLFVRSAHFGCFIIAPFDALSAVYCRFRLHRPITVGCGYFDGAEVDFLCSLFESRPAGRGNGYVRHATKDARMRQRM